MSPVHKEGNEPCFIFTIKYGRTTYASRVILFNENILPEPKVSKSLHTL